MAAVRESLRAPIENNDNAAPREERIDYGAVKAAHPIEDNGNIYLILVMGAILVVSLLAIILYGVIGFYDLWFGYHPHPPV